MIDNTDYMAFILNREAQAGGPGSGRHSEGGEKSEEIIHKGGPKHGVVEKIGKNVKQYTDHDSDKKEGDTYYRTTGKDSKDRTVFEHESVNS